MVSQFSVLQALTISQRTPSEKHHPFWRQKETAESVVNPCFSQGLKRP